MGQIEVGELAPDFTLPTQHNESWTLSEQAKQGPVVLFFYPKDNTSVCTAEACFFRDQHEIFLERGAQVVGISADSVESHQGFAGKHELPYTLLADSENTVRKLFGVKKALGVFPGRVTFIVDSERRVRHVFSSALNAEAHVEEALITLKRLQASS